MRLDSNYMSKHTYNGLHLGSLALRWKKKRSRRCAALNLRLSGYDQSVPVQVAVYRQQFRSMADV